jgi:hypothetical protein
MAKGEPIGEEMFENLERVFGVMYQDDRLTKWEQDFIEDLSNRLDEYGPKMYLSEKQWEIIQRIMQKCDVEL